MNAPEITAKAVVQVTVEIEASRWGGDCTIGQVHKQAGDEARARVVQIFSKSGECCRITGTKVIGVLTEQP